MKPAEGIHETKGCDTDVEGAAVTEHVKVIANLGKKSVKQGDFNRAEQKNVAGKIELILLAAERKPGKLQGQFSVCALGLVARDVQNAGRFSRTDDPTILNEVSLEPPDTA